MADLSHLSDADLMALAGKRQATNSLANISDDELLKLSQGSGTNPLRMAEFAARGFTDSALETIGAIPDAISDYAITPFMKAVGLGEYAGPPKGLTNLLKSGFGDVGKFMSAPLNAAIDFGPAEPTGVMERGAYGTGRGAADAASLMVPGAAVARTAQAGGTAQALGRALAAQPVMQTVSGATGGAVSEASGSDLAGLAAALAAPMGVGAARRAITPVGRQLAPEEQRLANLAEQMGIRLTAGQATGSKPLQAMESSFTQLPFTGRKQAAIYDAERTAFNRAALAPAGINADRASPGVISNAFETIGNQFDSLISRTPQVNIDGRFQKDFSDTISEYGRKFGSGTNEGATFSAYVDDIEKMLRARWPNGVKPPQGALTAPGTVFPDVSVDGKTYKDIASKLRGAERKAPYDSDLKEALSGLRNAVDSAMGRSVTPDVARSWGEARRNYRNLLQIDKAMATAPAADQVAGNLPLAGLGNAVRGADPRGYARGRGDLNDVARVGKFLSSRNIPDSGTAQRAQMMGALTGGVGGTGLGALAMGADPVTTALTLGATYGLPRLIQALSNSQAGQAYLRNNIAPGGVLNRELLAKILAGQEIGELKEGASAADSVTNRRAPLQIDITKDMR